MSPHARTRARLRPALTALAAAAVLAAPVAVAAPAAAAPGTPGVPALQGSEQERERRAAERREAQQQEEAEQQEAEQQEAEQQEPEQTVGQRALERAPEHDGKPYEYGATGPDSFDCSGFVQYVFGQVGYELPRTSGDQYAASQKVAQADRQPGDLIALHDGEGRVTHVGIYAGDDRMWVASTSNDRIMLQDVYTDAYYVGRFS